MYFQGLAEVMIQEFVAKRVEAAVPVDPLQYLLMVSKDQ